MSAAETNIISRDLRNFVRISAKPRTTATAVPVPESAAVQYMLRLATAVHHAVEMIPIGHSYSRQYEKRCSGSRVYRMRVELPNFDDRHHAPTSRFEHTRKLPELQVFLLGTCS